MGLLDGRVALISGIGPGMGRDLALAFAREGADVALTARTQSRLDAVAREVSEIGREALGIVGDVSSDDDCARIVETAEKSFGRIDILVNNAFQQPPFEPLETQSLAVIRSGLEINLLAALRLSQRVAPIMRRGGGGSIVMINSEILREPKPLMGAYKIAKHGLLGMAQALAFELGPDNIRVNTVAPWYIQGETLQGYFSSVAAARGITAAEVEAEIAADAALRRIPGSDEISDVAVFFASDLARAVTGQCLDVNCGAYFN
jgi:NAD(P)-dependent dehydrogenase (short-subunit alcohol dehydrogenase family)